MSSVTAERGVGVITTYTEREFVEARCSTADCENPVTHLSPYTSTLLCHPCYDYNVRRDRLREMRGQGPAFRRLVREMQAEERNETCKT